MATSVIAATACDQLASSRRMPRTSSNSAVPTRLAATPLQKAMPADHSPARSQKASPVHQYSRSMPKVAMTKATGKCTIITWIGWPTRATVEPMSSCFISSVTGLCSLAAASFSDFAIARLLVAMRGASIIAVPSR